MRPTSTKTGPRPAGFTLIELLVVISIIGILAGLLMPALSTGGKRAKIATAKLEINNIVSAINAYYTAYNRYPATSEAALASTQKPDICPDFTYGTSGLAAQTSILNAVGNYQANNAVIVAILRDDIQYIDPNSNQKVNANHAKNPEQKVFLNAKQVSVNNLPGIGSDGVFRDPWKNPYMISIDMNGDDRTRDAFYCKDSVSWDHSKTDNKYGYNGLSPAVNKANNMPLVDAFEARNPVMAWSFGPDGKVSVNDNAEKGFNKDNVCSWK